MSSLVPARAYAGGMGQAVADRTINRKITNADGSIRTETWEEVSKRVSLGNALLDPRTDWSKRQTNAEWLENPSAFAVEFDKMHHHLRQASLLMSGRHLQHGDENQPSRNLEVFCNCLDGSTRILTMEHGAIEIEKIAGQVVTVIAGDGIPRSATINEHGEQELFDIVFRPNTSGGGKFRHTVRATENHRWKLSGGEVTENLRVGDIIAPPKSIGDHDPRAVIHGLLYGDGSGQKVRHDHTRVGVSQGRTYASIRVCKQDAVRDQIHRLLDNAGYEFSTPAHAGGDRLYYVGKFPYAKDLPFTNDPEYIASFIYGWWLADGSKGVNHALEISTASEEAADWLTSYSGFAGYTVSSHRIMDRKLGDGSYPNGKALHVIRLRQNLAMRVESITPTGKAKVYCPEEPVTSTFVLANGLLTGNCSTSASTFLMFYLLLNGSGVGRSYDDAMIHANLNHMPIVVPVIDWSHPDVASGRINGYLTKRDAEHLYAGRQITTFNVPDSREGWAKGLEVIERMAYENRYEEVLLLEFTGVRGYGSPIKGMQDRPASGPGPLMSAIKSIAVLRDAGMDPWRAAIYADHYAAECVLVGGARRAARMSTKHWKDRTIFDFIELKRGGFLWSSNNSVCVDEEFRAAVRKITALLTEYSKDEDRYEKQIKRLISEKRITFTEAHAYRVLRKLAYAAYHDGTGEPAIINQDKLTDKAEGIEDYVDGLFAESAKYKLDVETLPLMKALAKTVVLNDKRMITNPCLPIDTWIATSEGARQIGDLINKPFKAVVNGKEYQATGFWKTGDKPVFKIKTNRGYEIRPTGNHELLVESDRRRKLNGDFNITEEWIKVDDLQVGDKLVLNRHNCANGTLSERYKHGWLLGQMVGDGGYNPSKYPSYVRFWGENKVEMAEYALDIMKTLPFSRPRPVALGEHIAAENMNGNSITQASRALDELAEGLITPATKNLLPELEKQDEDFCKGFLSGFFDADGSVQGDLKKGRSVRLSQSNIERLQVVQRMLARLGIISTVYENRREEHARMLPNGTGGYSEYDCAAQHELVITKDNIDRFRIAVNFFDKTKQTALDDALITSTRAPYKERFTAEIMSIEANGTEPVYDCTVEEVHRFDANGIIAHNCGEITLLMLGGYCTIADVVPFHASSDDDAEDAFRTAVRALIRVNLMDSLYNREVARTNRIGVSMTGFHEWVYDRFKFTWHDIVNEEKSKPMWLMLSRFKRAIVDEAKTYSKLLGVVVPHTDTTFKPAGCASLDTKIKTTDGVLSMKELFAEQGFNNLTSIPAGAWLEPTHSTFVLDENNDEKLVTRLYVNGVKEVFEIEFEDGVVAKLTGNHKLKTADGWKRVDELTENDEIIHY